MYDPKDPCQSDADGGAELGVGRVALGDIIRRSARRLGNKTAVLDSHTVVSFRELDDDSNRFANHILSTGLSRGSRIATICVNSVELLIAIFGINKAGMVWVPINPALGVDEITFVLTHAGVSGIVVDEPIAARAEARQAFLAITKHVLFVGAEAPNGFRQAISLQEPSEPMVEIHERDIALIMYTSGTTASPKGVMHCHLAVYMTALANIGEWSITRDDRLLITLPLFHCAAHIMITTFLAAGASVVLRSSFDAGDALVSIGRHNITVVIGLPMMYAAMYEHASRRAFASLRLCFYVMAPMARTLLPKLIADFCPNFALTMGQTEMYPMTLMFRPEQQLKRFGTYWGESAMINDTAIMDEDGRILGMGEVGEVVHRGPNVMLGYFRDPEATAESRRFGWHHTGDNGMFDQDGQLVFVDRKKDMIKSGGENISSVQVEEALFRHPAVTNAAVVGLPHPRWGESVAAFVKVKDGSGVTDRDLLNHCRNNLGAFQVPKAVIILDGFPMTGSGKVKKADLRLQYRDWFNVE